MDLTSWLLRRTPPRPLVLTAPGGTGARLAVERFARERGWRQALSPAEANLLVVAGGGLEPHATRVWHAMPAPRVRVDVPEELDAAVTILHNAGEQRKQVPRSDETGEVPMADRAPDRDGLMLDQLHVPLGPALPLWPAGLIVHTRLQGDVIQGASVELLDSGQDSYWSQRPAARYLDSSARLLALAGWTDAAATAQRLRDDALAGATDPEPLRKWARRVRRSRTLRWLLTGVGQADDAPSPLAGDALDRLYRWLDATTLTGRRIPHETQWTVDNLPGLLTGTELATARLTVASLDPDVELLSSHGAHHA